MAATNQRPAALLPVRLLLACTIFGPLTASSLEAQSCLGFSGDGFIGAAGATRREWSYTMTGFGGSGGLRIGRVGAVASYLKFSGTDEFGQTFGFQNFRATVGYEAITSSLSLCPVLTIGSEGVSSRDSRSLPYSSKPIFGGGLALGRRFSAPNSALAMIPSLIVTAEGHEVERLIEGDIQIRSRGMATVVQGGVTVEFGRVLVRPYVALVAVDNGWLRAGVRFGLTF
ncbi:MAG: hypothetical protein OXN89_07365 [Bryobacterales bacterium]|nr:hypothetical protein [Bryobacterales bacterium]